MSQTLPTWFERSDFNPSWMHLHVDKIFDRTSIWFKNMMRVDEPCLFPLAPPSGHFLNLNSSNQIDETHSLLSLNISCVFLCITVRFSWLCVTSTSKTLSTVIWNLRTSCWLLQTHFHRYVTGTVWTTSKTVIFGWGERKGLEAQWTVLFMLMSWWQTWEQVCRWVVEVRWRGTQGLLQGRWEWADLKWQDGEKCEAKNQLTWWHKVHF